MKTRNSGVVSLLELLKFEAELYVAIARTISWIETMADEMRRRHPDKMGMLLLDPEMIKEGPTHFLEMRDSLNKLSLDSAADQVTRILALFASEEPKAHDIAYALTELQNRIEDQLARRSFYQLRPGVAEYFEDESPFGDAVNTSFPSAGHNIREACKCFACERFDATVYHLMLSLEVVLRCLARKLRVGYSANWMVYLDRIDKALKMKSKKTSARKSSLKFMGTASALLRAIKEAWRDESMHMGSKYGSDQARDILVSVRAFMVYLSTELSERKV